MTPKLLPLLILIFVACEQAQPPVNVETEIQGTWELEQYVNHTNSKTDFESYGDSIVYQKHITKQHFTWFKYDRKNEQLLGMGGGSYRILNNRYVENIEFFYPPGSNELGQAIPFTFSFKKGKWYHTGYAKEIETDIETGKLTTVDSSKIEEIWVRTSIKPHVDHVLMGSWDLNQKRDSLTGYYFEYPEFIGYMKLITPTHFIWINYDAHGDEIYGAGSGPYIFSDGQYTEDIQMIFPKNTGQLDEKVTFKTNPYENQWKHFGYVPLVRIDTLTGQIIKDSILIDEIWIPHQADISEELAF